MSAKLFYIRDLRSVVGNCVLWWRPAGKGYTTELEKAGLFEEDYGKTLRETDEMVPENVAKEFSVTHVRVEPLNEAMRVYKEETPKP